MRRDGWMRRKELGDTILDTGVLVELLAGTEAGKRLAELIRQEMINSYTTEINITELRYLICRKLGWEKAEEIVNKLLNSGYIHMLDITPYLRRAAQLKCRRALSLVDCITIAAGEKNGFKVMFAKKEKELEEEINKQPFETQLIFLNEL